MHKNWKKRDRRAKKSEYSRKVAYALDNLPNCLRYNTLLYSIHQLNSRDMHVSASMFSNAIQELSRHLVFLINFSWASPAEEVGITFVYSDGCQCHLLAATNMLILLFPRRNQLDAIPMWNVQPASPTLQPWIFSSFSYRPTGWCYSEFAACMLEDGRFLSAVFVSMRWCLLVCWVAVQHKSWKANGRWINDLYWTMQLRYSCTVQTQTVSS